LSLQCHQPPLLATNNSIILLHITKTNREIEDHPIECLIPLSAEN
jgi:hypothetical protein